MKRIALLLVLAVYPLLSYSQEYPGGITGAQAWFQTRYTGEQTNFYWKDFSGDKVKLMSKEGTEYKQDDLLYVNFHPSLYTSFRDYHHFTLECTNLSQGSILGVFIPKQDFSKETFLYRVDGRKKEGFLVTNDKVFASVSSGKQPLDYGSEEGRDLKQVTGEPLEGDSNAFKETSARILTYERYNRPNTSIWGERTVSTITSGAYDTKDNPYLSSQINEELYDANSRFDGYVPEFLVYDRVLEPKERRQVESYLALKYGLTLEKSYLDSNGDVLWDLDKNKGFNSRITGILRDNGSGLYQPTSTTTYEESIDGRDYSYERNSYDGNVSFYPSNIDNLSASRYRLLVLGTAKTSELLNEDGRYAIWGDNNKSFKVTNNEVHGGLYTLGRIWKVHTNLPVVPLSSVSLSWDVNDLGFTGDNWIKEVSKLPSSEGERGTAVTQIPLKGKEGELSFEVVTTGSTFVKFGAKSPEDVSRDYGVELTGFGSAYTIEKGERKQYLGGLYNGQRLTLIKKDSTIHIVKNGDILQYVINIVKEDRDADYYGSVSMKKSRIATPSIKGFYHRGFVKEYGMELELSYLRGKTDLAPEVLEREGYKPYLIIDKTGKGDFSSPDSLRFVPYSLVDKNRKKLLFHNFFFDQDQSGVDAFTFGYKKPKGVVAYFRYKKASCDANGVAKEDGSIAVELKEGTGPFTYKLTGTNGTSYTGKEQTISGREFTISSLAKGDYKLLISDTFGKGNTFQKDISIRSICDSLVAPSRASVLVESSTLPLTDDPVTIDSKELTVYPVPTRRGEAFTVAVALSGDFKVYIHDMKGTLIDVINVHNSSGSYQVQARLNTSATYLVKVVSSSGKIFTKRIIVN